MPESPLLPPEREAVTPREKRNVGITPGHPMTARQAVKEGGRAARLSRLSPVSSEGERERTGPELSCPTCNYRCHWPICTKCGTPTPRGPWSLPRVAEHGLPERARIISVLERLIWSPYETERQRKAADDAHALLRDLKGGTDGA